MPETLRVVASDSELLERGYAGEVEAQERLLDRHRTAVAILPRRAPYFSVEASGQAALWWVPELGHPRLPFRVVWLALRAQGAVPPLAPTEHAGVWDAYVALSPAQRLAVWHHEVEGQGAHEIARHLGLAEAEVVALLADATAQLAGAVGEREVRALRTTLADVALGPLAAEYLARRPRPPRQVAPDATGPGRAAPVAALLAALASVVIVLVLANPPGGPTPAPGRAQADPLPGTLLQPVRRGAVVRPEAAATAPSARSGSPVAGAGQPTPTPQPGPGPGPAPGPPEPDEGDQATVDVQVTPDGVRLVVDPVVIDPVVVDVPLPGSG